MVIDLNKKIINIKNQPVDTRKVSVTLQRPSTTEDNYFSTGRATPVATGVFVGGENAPESHAAEPIKKLEDICRIQDYLLANNRCRDNLLFVCGINFGLRISDLLKLQVGHLLNAEGNAYNSRIVLSEQKTGKRRVVYMNDAVMDAADLYFGDKVMKGRQIDLNDYLFVNQSSNAEKNDVLTRRSVERMLKEVINDKCGIPVHASTHCLRKTFAYHVIMTAKDRSRAIEFLQKMLGHSSQAITLMYAGITDEEIMKTYQELNLGSMRSRARAAWDVSKSSGFKANNQQVSAVNQ